MITTLVAVAFAARPAISGQVLDRNGNGLAKAYVTLGPPPGDKAATLGTCEIVSDRDGNFLIDYLRDDEGERVKLKKRVEYVLEVFKPGYHTYSVQLAYRRGLLVADTVTMVEDTIDVKDLPENLDPALYRLATQSSGATYEGQ